MTRSSSLFGLCLSLAFPPLAEPLRVTTVVSPKPYYVGQAIEIKVEASPNLASTEFEAPRVAGALVFPMPAEPTGPRTARYVVVPERPGLLDIAAFRARAGDRSGASRSSRLVVANLPVEGRTSSFLGGVGPFEVQAEADPTSVQVGDTLEYRVKITGQAAWGSARPPDLGEWRSPTFTIDLVSADPQPSGMPERTFRYRLRVLKPGKVVLPPVAVAAFDPTTRRYPTKATSSVTIRVADVARFDPSRLDEPAKPGPTRDWRPIYWAFGAVAIGLGLALGFAKARRRSKRRASSARSLALDLARGLVGDDDQVEAARMVAEALTTFLHRVGGRAPGVLTPIEARDGFERLTSRPELAEEAETLLTRCDRARFGWKGEEASQIREEAKKLFERIAEALAKQVGQGRRTGPGEAVETA